MKLSKKQRRTVQAFILNIAGNRMGGSQIYFTCIKAIQYIGFTVPLSFNTEVYDYHLNELFILQSFRQFYQLFYACIHFLANAFTLQLNMVVKDSLMQSAPAEAAYFICHIMS